MIFNCPRCNGQFQAEGAGVVRCPVCGGDVQLPERDNRGTAWEHAEKGAWVEAFWKVIKESITRPVEFFHKVALGEGIWRPLLFAIIISEICFLITILYKLGFQLMIGAATMGPFLGLVLPMTWFATGVMLIIMPIMVTLAAFANAGITHVCLSILGAAKRDFAYTFRVVCYAMAAQVFFVILFVGPVIAFAGSLTLNIIGLKVVHDTTYGKSVLAIFLPFMVCCGMIFVIGGGALIGGLLSGVK